MFSRWIVTNITSARGTLHCRETRIPQLVISGQYPKDKDRDDVDWIRLAQDWYRWRADVSAMMNLWVTAPRS
jgi:hypothetical protein